MAGAKFPPSGPTDPDHPAIDRIARALVAANP